MKRLSVLILAALLLLSGCGKTEEPENPYRLKSYTSETTIAGIPQSSIRCDYFYDENGRICRLDSYWKGEPHRSEYPEYDEYGNILRNTVENPDGTQTVEEHMLTLDEAHRILRDEVYSGGTCQSIWEYAYDKDGNQTMQRIIRHPGSEEGPNTSQVNSTYDRDGNLLREEVQWNSDLPTCTEYSYLDGRLDRVSDYDEHGRLTGYTQYSYDETGLVVTMTTYSAGGDLEETVVNTYDEYGNLLTNESRNEAYDRSGKYVYTYELIEAVNAA